MRIHTRTILAALITCGFITEPEGKEGHGFLQDDDVHLPGGPAWQASDVSHARR